MKVFGVSGSLKAEGNTASAVRRALEVLEEEGAETRFVSLAGKDIHACTGCLKCFSGPCPFDDDITSVTDGLQWADGVIIGSPVYFGSVSGSLKVAMDRCLSMGAGKRTELLAGKVGAAIACAGFRNGGQELTIQCIHQFLLNWNMMVVSDGPPYSHQGATIAGFAAQDDLGMSTVDSLARNLAQALRITAGESTD